MGEEAWWSVAAAVAMVVGLFGVIVPVAPGLVLIWLAALVYGFVVGFGAIGIAVMVVLTVLVIVSFVFGVILPKREAEASGASKLSQFGGLVGAVIGFFVVPFVGLIVGAVVGVAVVELAQKGNWPEAWTATKGVAKGFGLSVLVDLGIGVVMIGLWSIWAATVVF